MSESGAESAQSGIDAVDITAEQDLYKEECVPGWRSSLETVVDWGSLTCHLASGKSLTGCDIGRKIATTWWRVFWC